MALIKRLILIVLLAVVFVYGMVFSINNSELIEIDLLVNYVAHIPLALWSGALLLLGVVLGLSFASLASIPSLQENKKLKKSLALAQKRLAKLDLK